MITYDNYLLIIQILMNLSMVDPIRINSMKRIIKKKSFLVELIIRSLKRFCVVSENEPYWRYTHFYSQYILLIHDRIYQRDKKSCEKEEQELEEVQKKKESSQQNSSSPSATFKSPLSSPISQKVALKLEAAMAEEEKPKKENDYEIFYEKYTHAQHVCISCILNCKLMYCLMLNNEYEQEIVEEFQNQGINKVLSSSTSPEIKGDISQLIPVLHEQSNSRGLTSLITEEESKVIEKKKEETKNEDPAPSESKKEDPLKKNNEKEKIYLIPVIDITNQLFSESNMKSYYSSFNTSSPNQRNSSSSKDIESSLLSRFIHFIYLLHMNRNIEFLENVEKKEFDYFISYIFHQFNIKY
jgi:hypothetical protein